MQYKIIVDKQSSTNPSSEKKEYIIDIEELRCKGDVYDSLVITKDEDYVMRRLELTEYHVLNILDNPIKEPLNDLSIELFEGDNYIYLIDMEGNKFYAEYIVKNDFTDTYITKAEFNSSIIQTAKQIEISVNEKLTGYSTTEEMNAAIKLESDNITSSVSRQFENVDKSMSTMSSRITQTAESINSKVAKGEVCSEINQSAEEISLKGNRLIVEADNFKLDKDGKIICSNATINGKIESIDGKIGGWTINSEGLSNGTVFIKNDGASTIYTVADLIIIRGYLMGYTGFNLSTSMIQHYDIDGDGQVTSSDYVKLQNLIGISMN